MAFEFLCFNTLSFFKQIHQILTLIFLCVHGNDCLLVTLSLRKLFWCFFSLRILVDDHWLWKVWICMNWYASYFIDALLSSSGGFLYFFIKIRSDLVHWFVKKVFIWISPFQLFCWVFHFEQDIVDFSCLVFNMDNKQIHCLRFWIKRYFNLRTSRFRLNVTFLSNELKESLKPLKIKHIKKIRLRCRLHQYPFCKKLFNFSIRSQSLKLKQLTGNISKFLATFNNSEKLSPSDVDNCLLVFFPFRTWNKKICQNLF